MRVAAAPLCALMVCLFTTSGSAADRRPDSRLRCADDSAARVVELALAESPTVRRLVQEVEQTDLIVFVRTKTAPMGRAKAGTRFLAATSFVGGAPGPRFLLIEFDAAGAAWDVIALLGHELQHAFEIGHDPSIRSEAALARFYTQIGWEHQADQFETAAAMDVGREVKREVRVAERQHGHALLATR